MDSTRDADCGLATSVVVDMVFLLCGFMAGIAEQQLAQLPATPAKVDRLGRAAGLERGSRTSGLKGLWVKLERTCVNLAVASTGGDSESCRTTPLRRWTAEIGSWRRYRSPGF